MNNPLKLLLGFALLYCVFSGRSAVAQAENDVAANQMMAGAAKIDITSEEAGPVDGRMHVRALVLKNQRTTAVLITVDAVAIGEIGHISNDYLGNVRAQIETELGIQPGNVLVNASHCHGIICKDVQQRTFQAVKLAASRLVPIRVGAGTGQEGRIMENRRLKLKSGKDFSESQSFSFTKGVKPKALGITLAGPGIGSDGIQIGDW